jgi:hypothetical protein
MGARLLEYGNATAPSFEGSVVRRWPLLSAAGGADFVGDPTTASPQRKAQRFKARYYTRQLPADMRA